MRTSKLAKKLKKLGNNCFFYLDNDTKFIKILKTFKVQYLYNQGRHFQNQLIDANLFLDRIKDIKGYVVVDDYRLGALWEKKISKNNYKIIAFDDLENRKHYSDIYINYKPDFHINSNFRRTNIIKKNCKILLGPQFSIIDCRYKKKNKKKNLLKIVFYTGGGGDLKNIYNILNHLLATNHNILKKIKIILVLGPLTANKNLILSLVNNYSKIQLIKDRYNIDDIIAEADLVIGSAGNLVYETSFYKIPSLFFQISKNQINNFLSMEKLGHYFVLPKKALAQKEKISNLIILIIENYSRVLKFSSSPSINVDNKGLGRIIKKITNKKKNKKDFYHFNYKIIANNSNSKNLKIRKVNDKDINHYLFSRNLIKNREVSITKKKISVLDHYIWWLNSKRQSYLLTKQGKKILYFHEEIKNFNNLNYSVQGWFAFADNCSLQDILYALNWQKRLISKRKDIKVSLGIINKKNKINFSKYLGWRLLDKNSYLAGIMKKIYKIDNNYLFYSRSNKL